MEKQQRRGIRFPTYPLSEALRLVRMVQDQGAGRLSTNATAVALDLSPNSSSFLSRVAAAKHFALVEDNEGILITTALAKRILRPTTANQEKEGLSEAFLNFQVFRQLRERSSIQVKGFLLGCKRFLKSKPCRKLGQYHLGLMEDLSNC